MKIYVSPINHRRGLVATLVAVALIAAVAGSLTVDVIIASATSAILLGALAATYGPRPRPSSMRRHVAQSVAIPAPRLAGLATLAAPTSARA